MLVLARRTRRRGSAPTPLQVKFLKSLLSCVCIPSRFLTVRVAERSSGVQHSWPRISRPQHPTTTTMRQNRTVLYAISLAFLLIVTLPVTATAAITGGRELIARSPQGPPEISRPDPFWPPPPSPPPPPRPAPVIEPPPQNVTDIRCRAEELSQGAALWILVILIVGCVVHLPGSVTFLGHKGLYRLTPEFGIVEAAAVIVLVIRGLVWYHSSFKISVQAALSLRHFLGEGESWWLEDPNLDTSASLPARDEQENLVETSPSVPESEAFERLDPFLGPLRSFSHARLLGLGLTTLALLKACVVTGTIRTTVLASSYYLSFITIELLAWTLLEPGPPRSQAELSHEAAQCAWLMNQLDPFKHNISDSYRPSPPRPQQRYATYIYEYGTSFSFPLFSSDPAYLVPFLLLWVLVGLMSASAVVHIFWPISVPLFILFDFTVAEKGKWTFIYLTWVPWVFWLVVAAIAISIIIFAALKGLQILEIDLSKLPPVKLSWPRAWRGGNVVVGAYAGAKTLLMIRHYLVEYTGKDTKKPNWVDWLG
jgi:hypothetical protein